jgi:hypothetical protein
MPYGRHLDDLGIFLKSPAAGAEVDAKNEKNSEV